MPAAFDGGNDPSANIFTRLLKNRVIMLGTDVNDDIANQICAQLLYLEGEDPNADIWLYINSPGGSVTAGMAIYDTMQFVSCDVATVCMGLAASMGQFLLTAGAPGKRYTLPNARIMMHQPLAGLRGQASDIAIQAEQLRYTKKRMAELIADGILVATPAGSATIAPARGGHGIFNQTSGDLVIVDLELATVDALADVADVRLHVVQFAVMFLMVLFPQLVMWPAKLLY